MNGEVEMKADPCPCGKYVRVGVWLDGNTGNWNAGDRHSGYFGIGDAPIMFFGKPVKEGQFIDWELTSDPCPCGKYVRVGVWLEGQEVGCVYVHNFMANCKAKA